MYSKIDNVTDVSMNVVDDTDKNYQSLGDCADFEFIFYLNSIAILLCILENDMQRERQESALLCIFACPHT